MCACACSHADAHFFHSAGFSQSSFVVLKKDVVSEHASDCTSMHFHHNPTDTQQNRARTHEVSFSEVQLHQTLSGARLTIRPKYFSPQVIIPTCTTRTILRTSTCLSPTTRCNVQPPVPRQKTLERTSSREPADEFKCWARVQATSCFETQVANRRNSQRS